MADVDASKASNSAIAEDERGESSEERKPLHTTPSTLHTEQSEVAQAAEPSALAKAFEQMKAKHPDAVLLFRAGDFYISFADDAKQVSEVCGVTLTLTRTSAKDITAQQAAFPAASLDTYLPKIVRAGKRVAICDTLQSAAPHSSSKLDSAFGLHDCCDEPSAQQESAPKKKATRKSAKKESK